MLKQIRTVRPLSMIAISFGLIILLLAIRIYCFTNHLTSTTTSQNNVPRKLQSRKYPFFRFDGYDGDFTPSHQLIHVNNFYNLEEAPGFQSQNFGKSVAVSSDGAIIVTAGEDKANFCNNYIQIWNSGTRELISQISVERLDDKIMYSPARKQFICQYNRNKFLFVDHLGNLTTTTVGDKTTFVRVWASSNTHLVYSKSNGDNTVVAEGHTDSKVISKNADIGKLMSSNIAISPCSSHLVISGKDEVRHWKFSSENSCSVLNILNKQSGVLAIGDTWYDYPAFLNNYLFAIASWKKMTPDERPSEYSVHLVNLNTEINQIRLDCGDNPVHGIAASPILNILAIALHREVLIVDATTLNVLRALKCSCAPRGIAFSQNGRMLVAIGFNGYVSQWNIGEQLIAPALIQNTK